MPVLDSNFVVISSSGGRSFTTRLMLGRYFADIVTDSQRSVFHWIVQRQGSNEILRLGQETSFSSAMERAHYSLESLAGHSRRQPQEALYEFGEQRQ
jgi:hypothetical protein